MSNPTILKNGVTFTFDDGEVKSVDVEKVGNLDVSSTPASDSNDSFIVDFNGVVKSIMISGQLFETDTTRTSTGTTTSIEDQQAWLEDLVDGSQNGYTFNSSYQTNKTVFCRRVKFSEDAGKPNNVKFSMELIEGA